jgi:hypothetical protein
MEEVKEKQLKSNCKNHTAKQFKGKDFRANPQNINTTGANKGSCWQRTKIKKVAETVKILLEMKPDIFLKIMPPKIKSILDSLQQDGKINNLKELLSFIIPIAGSLKGDIKSFELLLGLINEDISKKLDIEFNKKDDRKQLTREQLQAIADGRATFEDFLTTSTSGSGINASGNEGK